MLENLLLGFSIHCSPGVKEIEYVQYGTTINTSSEIIPGSCKKGDINFQIVQPENGLYTTLRIGETEYLVGSGQESLTDVKTKIKKVYNEPRSIERRVSYNVEEGTHLISLCSVTPEQLHESIGFMPGYILQTTGFKLKPGKEYETEECVHDLLIIK